MVQSLLFEVGIPLALVMAGDERKVEGLKLDLEDIDLPAVDPVLEGPGPLKGRVGLDHAGKKHQWVGGFESFAQKAWMGH